MAVEKPKGRPGKGRGGKPRPAIRGKARARALAMQARTDAICVARGWSLGQLARALACDLGTMSRWRHEGRMPFHIYEAKLVAMEAEDDVARRVRGEVHDD